MLKQTGEPEIIVHADGHKTVTTKFEFMPKKVKDLLDDSWTVSLRNNHKPKDKPMWMKTEAGDRLVNMNEQSVVYTFKRANDDDKEERWHVGLSHGFVSNSLKSFKYKEDAEKYLEELLVKLNDED